jgi:hypothetical protein
MKVQTDLVHLREVLSNFAKGAEQLLSAVPDRSRTRSVSPGIRRTLVQPNHKLQPAEIDQLVELYASGLDLTKLGRRFHVHRQTARSHLLRCGVELRPQWQSLSGRQVRDLVALYESGLSTYQLGARFERNPNTIRRVLLAAGVRMRSRGGT